MERTHSASDLGDLISGTTVNVGGRVLNVTADGVTLADAFGACRVRLADNEHALPGLGSWLVVRAQLQDPDARELTDGKILEHNFGQLLADGYFARFSRVGAALRARSVATRAARDFFSARGFDEVSTPVRVAAPGTDVYLEPQPSEERWLITSPEFHHKRLLAGGLPRIFELAHCTRKGERGPWHHPEFTMLEWYQAFANVEDVMAQTEALVHHLASALGSASELSVGGCKVTLAQPFARLSVAEAFRRFADVDDVVSLAALDEDTYFQLMVDVVDPAIAQLPLPVFLTHYPESQAALSRRSAQFPGFAERFELFIGGVELCNGYGELTDPIEQATRFAHDVSRRADKGLPHLPVDDGLLQALREGVPPCSGNAVGFDRLVSVLLGRALDDVVAFPP